MLSSNCTSASWVCFDLWLVGLTWWHLQPTSHAYLDVLKTQLDARQLNANVVSSSVLYESYLVHPCFAKLFQRVVFKYLRSV